MPAAPSPIATLVRFGRELRRAGLAVSLPQLECCARACGWLDPSSRSELYCAAQATLLTRREDLPVFQRVFDDFWFGVSASSAVPAPLAPRHRPEGRPALAALLAQKAVLSDPEVDVRDRSHAASEDEM